MFTHIDFHHFGLALKDDEDALPFLQGLGYSVSDRVYDSEQNVNLRICDHPTHPSIEMVLPGDGPGPLTPILKRYNELVYHLCYESAAPLEFVASLDAAGIDYAEVSPPTPAILFGGRMVSFYRVRGFGVMEIIWPE
jgi:hypothetical protein